METADAHALIGKGLDLSLFPALQPPHVHDAPMERRPLADVNTDSALLSIAADLKYCIGRLESLLTEVRNTTDKRLRTEHI